MRRLESTRLVPQIDDNGVGWFDPTEVKTLQAERGVRPVSKRLTEGEVAAQVFDLFRRGFDLRQVVISARVHPAVVRTLYSEWLVDLREGEQWRRSDAQAAANARHHEQTGRDAQRFERNLRRLVRPQP